MVEGFAGYSLPDDLLSGMGLAIAYGCVLSIPFVGGQFAVFIWDGNFPGSRRSSTASSSSTSSSCRS